MPGGRPTKYCAQVVDEICNRMSLGESLIKICKDEHLPTRETIRAWITEKPEFSARYAKAREDQQDYYAEEILEIANDESRDVPLENGKGGYSSNMTAVQRDRLRVDSLKWIMSKVAPKKYGDKIQQEITGKDGEMLIPSIVVTIEK